MSKPLLPEVPLDEFVESPKAILPIEFFESHRPALATGDYTISLTLQLEDQQNAPPTEYRLPERPGTAAGADLVQHISVLGPRFALGPDMIDGQYPATGAVGVGPDTLPHVSFSRATLPWERRADPGDPAPWLALLCFTDDPADPAHRAPVSRVVRLGDLVGSQRVEPGLPPILAVGEEAEPGALVLDRGDHLDDRLTLIDVPASCIRMVPATTVTLASLVHVRRTRMNDGSAPTERATVLCGTTPAAGVPSVVHLVSVEGRYLNGQLNLPNSGPLTLVSLKSWRFVATEHVHHDLAEMTGALDIGPLRLPEVNDTAAERYLASGAVPMPMGTRHGLSRPAFYRGPLMAADAKDRPDIYELAMGATRAEDLFRFDASIDMPDASLAVAWELGRMLTLNNSAAARSLYAWRRCCYQRHCDAASREVVAGLPCFRDEDDHPFPDDWFGALTRLQGIPFSYLVPDERMLPRNSLRFFMVDPNWMTCMLYGALALGTLHEAERACIHAHSAAGKAKFSKLLSGCLIRSELLSAWPDLVINAHGIRPESPQSAKPEDLTALGPPRRLSPSIALCLFEGRIERLDLELHPAALHFRLGAEMEAEDLDCLGRRTLKGVPDLESLRGPVNLARGALTPKQERRIWVGSSKA